MRRFGQVIKLRPGNLEEYRRYHAAIWPQVAEMITACNIRNYSIYHREGTLFSYFEYHGTDFEADMAKMAADPKTQEWWAIMKPMQERLPQVPESGWWATMEEVFHQE